MTSHYIFVFLFVFLAGIKRVPSYVAPDLASDIRRHFAASLRVRKNMFNCHYITEHATFSLSAEIEELLISVQEQLYEELLDRDAQKQLESSPPALNWSLEITARLGSRLMVLWNRSAGDCLLDSVMQQIGAFLIVVMYCGVHLPIVYINVEICKILFFD